MRGRIVRRVGFWLHCLVENTLLGLVCRVGVLWRGRVLFVTCVGFGFCWLVIFVSGDCCSEELPRLCTLTNILGKEALTIGHLLVSVRHSSNLWFPVGGMKLSYHSFACTVRTIAEGACSLTRGLGESSGGLLPLCLLLDYCFSSVWVQIFDRVPCRVLCRGTLCWARIPVPIGIMCCSWWWQRIQNDATLFDALPSSFKVPLSAMHDNVLRSLLSVHALSWHVSVGYPGHGLCQP